jgi:hypothetical protein
MMRQRQNCFLLCSNGTSNFVLGNAAYDSEKIRQTTEQSGIIWISSSTTAIARNGKMPTERPFLPFCVFLKTGLTNGCLNFVARRNGCLMSESVTDWSSHDGVDFIDVYYM